MPPGLAGQRWATRPALPSDEAQVTTLWHECGLVASYNDPAADFRAALANPGSTILVASSVEDAVGPAILGTVMAGDDGHRGWLYYVAAFPALRGQGLGRFMVRAGEAWLAGRGVAKVQLLVRETNTQVVGFYESLGYEVAPRTVMARWLDRG